MSEEYESPELTMEEEISRLRSLVAEREEQLLDLEQEGEVLSSNCVILVNNSSAIVLRLCGIIQDLTANVESFVRVLQAPGGTGSRSPLRTQPNNPEQDLAGSLSDLGSSVEEFMTATRSANSGLSKASRDWENSQERVKRMKARAAKSIVGKILENKKRKRTVEPVKFPVTSGYYEEEAQNAAEGPGPFRADFPRDFRVRKRPNRLINTVKRFMRVPGPANKPTPDQDDDHPNPMEETNETPDEAKPEGPSKEDNLDPGGSFSSGESNEVNGLQVRG